MSSGALPGAQAWTPLCGVDQPYHGSTVVSDPVQTRQWPTSSQPAVLASQHPGVSTTLPVAPVVGGPSSDGLFSTPLASALFPPSSCGSYIPPVRAAGFANGPSQSCGAMHFSSTPEPFNFSSGVTSVPI